MRIKLIKESAGYVFRWDRDANGGPGFYCGSTFSTVKKETWDNILKSWDNGRRSRNATMQKLRRMGGKVCKVAFVEVKI